MRNRTPAEIEENSGSAERLEKERSLFSNRQWNSLSANRRGTPALRRYLAELLCSHIEKVFPTLLEDITALRSTASSELEATGASRAQIEQKRPYLTQIAQEFKARASQSIHGRYSSVAADETKLRMKICETNDAFALKMRENGHLMPFQGISMCVGRSF